MTINPPPAHLLLKSFDNRLWDDFDWRHALFILLMMTLAMLTLS